MDHKRITARAHLKSANQGGHKTWDCQLRRARSAWPVSATEFQLRRGNNSEVDSDKPVYRY